MLLKRRGKMTDKKEPIYAKAPGQGKKPMIMRALAQSVGRRAQTVKVTLPTLKSMEEKK
jgi:hypothetical protein